MKQIPKEILDRLEWQQAHYKVKGEVIHNPRITKILPLTKPCEDCDLVVEDRQLAISINHNTKLKNHVRTQCKSCGLFKHPETGEFTCTYQEVVDHYRKKKYNKV